jgi:uncharacterized protein (TIGR03435 family)
VAKNGPKFKEAAPPAAKKEDDAKRPPVFTPPKMGDDGYPVLGSKLWMVLKGRGRLHSPQTTLGDFAAMLQGRLAKPVIDATGLTYVRIIYPLLGLRLRPFPGLR